MTELLSRIANLPQVLQDYIGMFNVEHRRLMTSVSNDINNNLLVYCDYCSANNCVLKKDAFYTDILGTTFCYCSDYCEFNHGHEYRRKYYKYIRLG
jgi:hypothetical protein